MVLLDNLSHGDMHPGNVLVRRRGERLDGLAFLDVGVAAELPEESSARANFVTSWRLSRRATAAWPASS